MFLAILALSKAPLMAARAAGVAINTVRKHRAADPDFELQYEEAEEHALQLLHDVTMKSAIEGECEPVFWQGIQVGHIKEVDNRLRIEMLRAHMPKVFKTTGSKIAINTGSITNSTMIVDACYSARSRCFSILEHAFCSHLKAVDLMEWGSVQTLRTRTP